MASHDLLALDLRSPLAYRGIENPPLAGVPFEGDVLLPCPDGKLRPFPIGHDLAEGEEELFAFDADELVAFDADEGPRLARGEEELPPARFYGRSTAGSGGGCKRCSAPCSPDAANGIESAGGAAGPCPQTVPPTVAGSELLLPAGHYLFLQWRPAEAAELAEGIEWFAREAWWEGNSGAGPYFLRRIKEDGQLATQLLRRA